MISEMYSERLVGYERTDGIGLEKSLIQIYRSRSESESSIMGVGRLPLRFNTLGGLFWDGNLYPIPYFMCLYAECSFISLAQDWCLHGHLTIFCPLDLNLLFPLLFKEDHITKQLFRFEHQWFLKKILFLYKTSPLTFDKLKSPFFRRVIDVFDIP